MTVYQAISLMQTFGLLIIALLYVKNKKWTVLQQMVEVHL
ncbi:putative holin-like toxin [Chengkuizengella sediminis]